MQFEELISSISSLEVYGDTGVGVTGVFYDSRRVKPGGVFVAIRGHRVDGRDFIGDAKRHGGAAFIVEDGTDTVGLPAVAVVGDTRLALAEAAAIFYGRPAESLTNIAVTGTNGKTTVCSLLNDILRKTGSGTVLLTTVGGELAGEKFETKLTTEEAPNIQRYLAEAVKAGADTAIIEASSIGIYLKRVAAIPFDVAIFTNLSHDHTDFHGDMEDYYRSKRSLFFGLRSGARALINAGDDYGQRLIDDLRGRGIPIATFGIKDRSCDFSTFNVTDNENGIRFTVEHPVGETDIELPLGGSFNALNATAAFATAVLIGIPPDDAAAALCNAEPVKGRFETVEIDDNLKVIIDYAHSPDSVRRVLDELRREEDSYLKEDTYLIAVFGCTGDRDKKKRPVMGEIAVRRADYVIVTSDDLYSEAPARIAADVEAGITAAGGIVGYDYEIETDRAKAIRKAIFKAGEGRKAVIALLGKGHEKYQIMGDEYIPFNDREEVLKAADERTTPEAVSVFTETTGAPTAPVTSEVQAAETEDTPTEVIRVEPDIPIPGATTDIEEAIGDEAAAIKPIAYKPGADILDAPIEEKINEYASRARTHLVDEFSVIDSDRVFKSFGEKDVLRGTCIEIGEGETRVIIGRSGCGKSVFIKHMIGLLRPDSGSMKIDGEEITEMSIRDLYRVRKKFGMVFQGAALFDSLSVGENVGFALYEYSDLPRDEIDEMVSDALRKVGMTGIENLSPAELSGGMKKRVGLARAIVAEPKIILYDEPTTGLDPITADVINDLIVYFASELDITSVVVTHDMVSAYKIADKISMMFGGQIIETGRPDGIKETDNPFVRQFIEGHATGPIELLTGA
ncbi:MAG: UDP-N-acetylmuramoyl-L-alanyl-D-glutamate--2,6-diaminopimelate ligase [bacterium]|nr:UDP-N-acetylmuramoyl-L-alanyl-D-glutamate--2,6-diaminopimelate ligase [bacterium]